MLDLITMFAAVGAQSELDKVHKDTGVSSPLTSEAQEQVLLFSLSMFHVFSAHNLNLNAISSDC